MEEYSQNQPNKEANTVKPENITLREKLKNFLNKRSEELAESGPRDATIADVLALGSKALVASLEVGLPLNVVGAVAGVSSSAGMEITNTVLGFFATVGAAESITASSMGASDKGKEILSRKISKSDGTPLKISTDIQPGLSKLFKNLAANL